MKLLEQNLGRVLSVKQVSKYLNINEKTVREHFQELGGIRLGRHFKFFERRIIDAVEKRQEIYSADQEERSAEREGISDTEGSESVGSKDEKNVRRRVERQDDKHGLFN
jgi:hypothetical protein